MNQIWLEGDNLVQNAFKLIIFSWNLNLRLFLITNGSIQIRCLVFGFLYLPFESKVSLLILHDIIDLLRLTERFDRSTVLGTDLLLVSKLSQNDFNFLLIRRMIVLIAFKVLNSLLALVSHQIDERNKSVKFFIYKFRNYMLRLLRVWNLSIYCCTFLI